MSLLKTLIASAAALWAGAAMAGPDIERGLVAHYCFNSAKHLARDCSGNNHDGQVMGSVVWTKGYRGHGALFGGYDRPGSIVVPNSRLLQFNDAFSITYSVKLTGVDGMDENGLHASFGLQAAGAKSQDRAGAAFMMAGDASHLYAWIGSFEWNGNGNWMWAVLSDVNPTKWNHYAYVFSNKARTAWLYINGTLAAYNPYFQQDFTSINQQDLILGKFANAWYPLNGALDDVRVYKRALTAAEVDQLARKMD